MGSHKLTAFRKFTSGYTGQKSFALRVGWQLNIDEINHYKDIMRNLITSNFDIRKLQWTAYHITQCLRGELFILVDQLLNHQKPLDSEELKEVLRFLITYQQFYVAYMKKFH